MNTIAKTLLILSLAAAAFAAGTSVERGREHRSACAQQKGAYTWNGETCSFVGAYDDEVRLALSASCPTPGKSWYFINNTDTGWFHKCD